MLIATLGTSGADARARRVTLGLTLGEAGSLVGVSAPTLSRWERRPTCPRRYVAQLEGLTLEDVRRWRRAGHRRDRGPYRKDWSRVERSLWRQLLARWTPEALDERGVWRDSGGFVSLTAALRETQLRLSIGRVQAARRAAALAALEVAHG